MVLADDAFFGEPLTQWLLHLMLCRRYGLETLAKGVVDPWFALYVDGAYRLGNPFGADAFLALLRDRYGERSYLKSLAGLVPRTYLEGSCLSAAGVLQPLGEGELYRRRPAPLDAAFFPAYAAYLYLLWDQLFAAESQLDLAEFAAETRLYTLLGWEPKETGEWLDWMADTGLVQLDRHTGGVLMLRLQGTEQVLSGIYSELV